MSTRPFALVAGLAILTAACASVPTATTIDYGSGPRLLVTVADTLDNVGLASSVAVDSSGLPFVSYFGFPAEVKPSQIPVPRPIGTPFLPGVLLATVSAQGMWTQGAIEQNKPSAVPAGVTVPFGPVSTANFKLAEDDSNGTAVAVGQDGTIHAAWTLANGVYYGTTKAGGSATVTQVYDYKTSVSLAGPMSAPGIALDAGGNPWVAFSVLGPKGLEVHAASLQGSKWNDQIVATEPPCDSCHEPGPAAVELVGGKLLVVFGDPVKHEIDTATQKGSGWTVESLATGTDGVGLAAASVANTLYVSYYTSNGAAGITVVKGGAPSTGELGPTKNLDLQATGNDAPRTAITAQNGTIFAAWDAGDSGVQFVSGTGDSFTPISLGPSAASSAHPALGTSDQAVYLSWYDTVSQDLMVGIQGDVQNVIVAQPQPSLTISPPPASGAPCSGTKVQLDITAQGTAFSTNCLIADAGKPFTINFDNKDAVSSTGPHNIGIYTKQGGNELFRGDPANGPVQVKYNVNALDSGTYFFQCDFHPTQMFGTFSVVK